MYSMRPGRKKAVLCGIASITLSMACLTADIGASSGITTAIDSGVSRQVVGSWPKINPGDTEYVVQPSDGILTGGLFKIPDNFTIKVPPGLKGTLSWSFERFEFGNDCTIDLSPPQNPPPIPAPARPRQGQPFYGLDGEAGIPGTPGTPASNGVNLDLRIGRIILSGSLWIRTDGGPGGAGGSGGTGGLGGGSACGLPVFGNVPHTDGGRGGRGGDGGKGGQGGYSAQVNISVKEISDLPPPQVGCNDDTCGPSTRPGSATGNRGGLIVAWGARGCPGVGGSGGAGGKGGDGPETNERDCPWPISDPHGGSTGESGQSGVVAGTVVQCLKGDPGGCKPIRFTQMIQERGRKVEKPIPTVPVRF
jgi:hypothetical protein